MSWILIPIAYLIGSCTSAVIVCRCLRLPDPRQVGSGNPGATNVLRIGGKKAAVLTLFLDILKGFIPVMLAHYLAPHLTTWVMFAAFVGHLYPLFFGFIGGKGVATAFGGLLAWQWPLALLVLATWITTAFIFRYSSLAAMSAALGTLFYLAVVPSWHIETPLVLMVLGLLWRHRQNCKRLVTQLEPKLRFRSG